MGFAFAVIPMLRKSRNLQPVERNTFLIRHVKLFNTHPCLAAAVVGSVVKVEEAFAQAESPDDHHHKIIQLKNTMMSPYAAIGDAFFWGSLRPFAAIVAVAAALGGMGWASFAFLILYEPAHLWIRTKGFSEGYRLAQEGFRYIQMLNLPTLNPRIRWLSVVCLALLLASWTETAKPSTLSGLSGLMLGPLMLVLTLLGAWAIRRHWSSLALMYTMAVALFFISI